MTLSGPAACPQEREVLDLVAIGQWPERADVSLREHVALCAECAEVASVADAIRQSADHEPRPVLPDASVVWYRAQVRARELAARRAARPVLVAQLIAVASIVVATMWLGPGIDWLLNRVPDVTMPSLSALSINSAAWWPDAEMMNRWRWLGWSALAAAGVWALVGTIAWAVAGREVD